MSETAVEGAGQSALRAEGLTKEFAQRGQGRRRGLRSPPGLKAVSGVSLALPAGRITAVVGESGSGKSTLARMMARLVRPTSGRVLLDETPVGRLRGREFRRQVQLVFQDPFSALNPVHTVRYHLERPLLIHHKVRGRGGVDGAIKALLDRVNLNSGQVMDKLPHTLSGGQLQRVAIARALASEPRVLLADEPVSMLDVSIRLGVLNLLDSLRSEDGLAILYVTHDIASARYLSDTVAVMYAGQVVEYGDSLSVTETPAHPYTRLLLASAPDPDNAEVRKVSGQMDRKGPKVTSSGCPFRLRCSAAMAVCAEADPPEFSVASGHTAACWLHDGGARIPVPESHRSK